MRIEFYAQEGWHEVPRYLIPQAKRLLAKPIDELRFMQACDVGWTGMMFICGDITWIVYDAPDHIVDVRKARSYG